MIAEELDTHLTRIFGAQQETALGIRHKENEARQEMITVIRGGMDILREECSFCYFAHDEENSTSARVDSTFHPLLQECPLVKKHSLARFLSRLSQNTKFAANIMCYICWTSSFGSDALHPEFANTQTDIANQTTFEKKLGNRVCPANKDMFLGLIAVLYTHPKLRKRWAEVNDEPRLLTREDQWETYIKKGDDRFFTKMMKMLYWFSMEAGVKRK